MVSLTTGVRYDIDKRFQIGGLLGMDDGSIEGALVDTDAQGIVGGIFGRYLVDEASNTRVTASVSYGSFDYDSNRHSFGGDADADSISSDAFELALGVSTVAFKKDGFRVVPNATLRYMAGSVDGFEEDGPGIALRVEEQDLDSVLLDLGVDFEYQAQKNLLLIGRIGYVTDFEDSDNSVGARFAASGPDASPFTVSAPGIEDEAFVLGLGTYYDFSESTRVSLTYRGEFRTHSEYTQSIGIGASFGF
jgi:outer membrane autotransporter protein